MYMRMHAFPASALKIKQLRTSFSTSFETWVDRGTKLKLYILQSTATEVKFEPDLVN